MSILDAAHPIDPGTVILHTDEERDVLWTWRPHSCQVNIICATSGEDIDVFNWVEAPDSVARAVHLAADRVKRLQEECDAEMEDYDGQPDEAQEWFDYDPEC